MIKYNALSPSKQASKWFSISVRIINSGINFIFLEVQIME